MKQYTNQTYYFQIIILILFFAVSSKSQTRTENNVNNRDDVPARSEKNSAVSAADIDIGVSLEAIVDSVYTYRDDVRKYIRPGEIITVDLLVRNFSADTAQNVHLLHYVPAELRFLSSSRQPEQVVNDSLMWTFNAIAPFDSITLKIDAQCLQNIRDSRTIYPSLRADVENDLDWSNNLALETLIILPSTKTWTDVGITITSLTDTSIIENGQQMNAVFPGDVFQYSIALHNLSANSADSLVVSLILPPDVDFMSSSLLPANHTENFLTWILAELPGNEAASWVVDVRVDQDIPPDLDELICFASFTCLNDSVSTNDSYTDIVKVIRLTEESLDVDVEISAETDTSVQRAGTIYPAAFQNEEFHYIIRVNNSGSSAINNLHVVQSMPDAVVSTTQFPRANTVQNQLLSWTLPYLDSGQATTLIVVANGTVNAEGLLSSFVHIYAAENPANEIQSDSVAVWFLVKTMPTPKNCDISLDYHVLADSTIQINGASYPATRYDETFRYALNVSNAGPATAYDIQLVNTLSESIQASYFSHIPQDTTGALYFWHIDSLRAGESWTLNYFAKVKETNLAFPFLVTATAEVNAENDTILQNNSKDVILYILGDPVPLPDLAVRQTADVDSFETTESELLPIVVQDTVYSISVTVSNWSFADAENVFLSYVVDDSLTIIGTRPSPDIYTPDSVVWRLGTVKSNYSLKFGVDVQMPQIMPVSRNLLYNTASVTSENEDVSKLTNNRSVLTLVNYGEAAEPFEPLIELTPDNPTVSDSIRIRVSFPVAIKNWDLWIYLPNGEIITDFADSYIQTKQIEPGAWYDIDVPYLHRTLLSSESSDDLLFEVRATGRFGVIGSSQQRILVNLDFELSPPNVVSPGTTAIPIDFAVAAGRVEMKLYDVAGRHITDLANSDYAAGRHTLVWDGKTENGQLVGSGVYLITLHTEQANTWRKMIIVR
ncbi:hypothetical protein EH223_17820 [candidate division KSB1 bacterium]|nr:hypothetical protein [candidate division KSB1 bacterium]RQW00607.1 MAG: hypothetical protein EH223_17820 [candidate division KSB1 bacterium]